MLFAFSGSRSVENPEPNAAQANLFNQSLISASHLEVKVLSTDFVSTIIFLKYWIKASSEPSSSIQVSAKNLRALSASHWNVLILSTITDLRAFSPPSFLISVTFFSAPSFTSSPTTSNSAFF